MATSPDQSPVELRKIAGRLTAAATGIFTGSWVAYLTDPWLGVVVGVLSAIVVPLGRAVSNPKVIVDWLNQAAAVPPAVTRLLFAIEREWRRWRQRDRGGGSA
jgi:hypothetical protein